MAVSAVALDHADLGLMSGGFVGVDVFFVISGFLITQLLLSEAQRTGTIRLSTFYSRRAKRILPAATVVIVSTLAASALLLNYVQTTAIVKDAMWATLFAANVQFSRDETDYFAADDPASPLQHFWSLAVEEQFYLAWPVILACLVAGYAVWRRRTGRSQLSRDGSGWVPLRWILMALAAIGAVSLIWSIVLTDAEPTQAYFSTFARAWELAAGAACAVGVPRLSRLPLAVRTVTAWMGLAAILTAVVTYSSATRFPGSAALLPVLGSALHIAGGSGRVRGAAKACTDAAVGGLVVLVLPVALALPSDSGCVRRARSFCSAKSVAASRGAGGVRRYLSVGREPLPSVARPQRASPQRFAALPRCRRLEPLERSRGHSRGASPSCRSRRRAAGHCGRLRRRRDRCPTQPRPGSCPGAGISGGSPGRRGDTWGVAACTARPQS